MDGRLKPLQFPTQTGMGICGLVLRLGFLPGCVLQPTAPHHFLFFILGDGAPFPLQLNSYLVIHWNEVAVQGDNSEQH